MVYADWARNLIRMVYKRFSTCGELNLLEKWRLQQMRSIPNSHKNILIRKHSLLNGWQIYIFAGNVYITEKRIHIAYVSFAAKLLLKTKHSIPYARFAEIQLWNAACVRISILSVFIRVLRKIKKFCTFLQAFPFLSLVCWLYRSSPLTLLRISVPTMSSDKSLRQLSVTTSQSGFSSISACWMTFASEISLPTSTNFFTAT